MSADLTRTHVRRSQEATGRPWVVWIPPSGPHALDGDDPAEAPLLAQYGDTYWPTWAEAVAFAFEHAEVSDWWALHSTGTTP